MGRKNTTKTPITIGIIGSFPSIFHEIGIANDTISCTWGPRTRFPFENIDATYADANGDGIVDEKDVIGIGVNWGNTHENGNTLFTINVKHLFPKAVIKSSS